MIICIKKDDDSSSLIGKTDRYDDNILYIDEKLFNRYITKAIRDKRITVDSNAIVEEE